MPISKTHKILFIHIPKNGGKTLEKIFEVHNSYEGSPNSRSKVNAFFKLMLKLTRTKKAYTDLMGVIDKSYAAQHLTYQEIQLGNWIEADYLESLIKVAVIRNPYDRAFSLFNHWVKNLENMEDNIEEEFFKFLHSIKKRRNSQNHNEASHFRKQIEYIRDVNGDFSSMKLLKLEELEDNISSFCEKNNITLSYRDILRKTKYESSNILRNKTKSNRNIQMVYELYIEDYKILGYDI